jgi:hypothetical protein
MKKPRIKVNSHEYNTYKALMRAGLAAKARNHDVAHAHYDAARKFEKRHVDHLSSHERHDEIKNFKSKTHEAFSKLESMLSSIPRPSIVDRVKAKIESLVPSKEPKALKVKKSEKALEKNEAFRQYHATGKFPAYNRPKEFGRKAGYDYKAFHELSSEQQHQARKRYPGDPAGFHYPIHPETNEVAAGITRFKSKAPPQATEHFPPIDSTPAHHKEGALVYINDKNHDFHGTFGRVRGDSHLPGKLKVEIYQKNRTQPDVVHVEGHQITPKSEFKKSDPEESDNVILLKSKATLKRAKSKKK